MVESHIDRDGRWAIALWDSAWEKRSHFLLFEEKGDRTFGKMKNATSEQLVSSIHSIAHQ